MTLEQERAYGDGTPEIEGHTSMVRMPEGAEGPIGDARHSEAHPVLNLARPFDGTIPDSSVPSVRKVAKFDGRTRIVAAREPGGQWWKLRQRMRFTREHANLLRDWGVSEVVLRRGLRGASFPLAWMSRRS